MQNTPANTMQKYENGGRNKSVVLHTTGYFIVLVNLHLLVIARRFRLCETDEAIWLFSSPPSPPTAAVFKEGC